MTKKRLKKAFTIQKARQESVAIKINRNKIKYSDIITNN